jgi:hypothetical protein
MNQLNALAGALRREDYHTSDDRSKGAVDSFRIKSMSGLPIVKKPRGQASCSRPGKEIGPIDGHIALM